MAADYPTSETASEPKEGKWKEITLNLDGTDIKVSLLRKGRFANYDRDGSRAEALKADVEEMLDLCDKFQANATEKPDPTLEKIQRLAIRVVSNDGCDFDLKMLAAEVLVETRREKMEKAASERVVEFTGSKTMSGEAAREALGYPPVSEKDLNPPATETEKMIPLSAVKPFVNYVHRRLMARAEQRSDDRNLVDIDPVLVVAYDLAAQVVGWPSSGRIMKVGGELEDSFKPLC